VAGAGSERIATAVATAALAITGDRDAVAAGRARLAAMGGVDAVTDPALAHLCRQFLVLAGLAEPSGLRRLPLEVVLFDRVRRLRISFRTAPFVAMALMQARADPPGPLRRATGRLAQPGALRLLAAIHEHEGRTGVFSEDPWPAALVCLGLARARVLPDVTAAIAGYLRRSACADGAWQAVPSLDLTRSAFAATGLVAAGYGADPRLARTSALFHRSQQHEPFVVFDCPPGGWSYNGARGWPVTLESAEILSALAGMPGHADDPALRTGLDWLVRRQDTRGSWSLWVRDTKLPNDGPCPAITSQGISALLDAGHHRGSPPVAAAVRWLRTQQRPDGTFENLWYRDFTSGTAMVLAALGRAGDAAAAGRARDWLLAAQRPDGAWGPGTGSGTGTVEETAWALHALLESGVPATAEPLLRAADRLLDAQGPDGAWPPAHVCVYVRHHMHYPNPAIAQGLALRALGTWRSAVEGAP
jgi:squalene-hopene/tetraprenyl-beta-curcumene cyclase